MFSYKLMLSILVGMVSHAQNTQNNKYAISLQYLKERVSQESWFFACW